MRGEHWAVVDLEDMPGDSIMITRWHWYAHWCAFLMNRNLIRRKLRGSVHVVPWRVGL